MPHSRQGSPFLASFAPLVHTAYRRVWLAGIPSNFGLLFNAVGAGQAMKVMSGDAAMVALVQTS